MVKKKNIKGLTILEVLISIGIVSSALGSVIYLLVKASHYSISAETRSIAVSYAQEAADIVKNVRDNKYCRFFNVTGAVPYNNNQYYRVQIAGVDVNIIEMPGTNNSSNAVNGMWEYKYPTNSAEARSTGDAGYGTTINGGMRRSVYMQGITGASDTNRKVTVTVEWSDRGTDNPATPVTETNTYRIVTEVYKWKY